eukprot:CAMPEP_0170452376 /NCGR_PEP_ID=MMETSP0123-20130129/1294_1 /TAXON_ID=182087 /ORGANISM="Favella ehrenbergii, Strain Fehren 1" /LENGTH=117 /DNA_ID=CAMNT_0010714359 /DNA_START=580 /DNA_END=933 /DNA_ORIENTATION=+
MSITKKKRSKSNKSSKRKRHQTEAADEMSMMPSDGSQDERSDRSFTSAYQVGEIDSSGFVHLGIEERQLRPSKQQENNMNRTFFGYGGAGALDNSGEYSSSEDYSSDQSTAGCDRTS